MLIGLHVFYFYGNSYYLIQFIKDYFCLQRIQFEYYACLLAHLQTWYCQICTQVIAIPMHTPGQIFTCYVHTHNMIKMKLLFDF